MEIKSEEIRVTFSPDGNQIVISTKDGQAKIFDSKIGAIVGELQIAHHSNKIINVCFTPDNRLITCCNFGPAMIWDAEKGALIG